MTKPPIIFHYYDDRPEKEKREKQEVRSLWFLWVPLAAVFAFFLTLMANDGGVFLPAWGVLSVVLWGAGSALKGEK